MVDNFGMDWSGSGWSSKEVLNEINSIPEFKPPPKFSTTRAQPRNQNGINNVVEGDFHYHNNIENVDFSPGSSVQVDDFYYDYNFINFHEDLSDDFEDEGSDSGDSNSLNTPQEAKPTISTDGNPNTETTKGPTPTPTISTVSKEEEQVDKDLDNMKNDFLSEDYLLPVFTTRSPPLSPTRRPRTQTERHDDLLWPEKSSTMPDPLWTTAEPFVDVKYGAEVENKYDRFPEDVSADNVTAAPTPPYQTTINTVVTTTMAAPEEEARDGNEYSYDEKSWTKDLGADIFAVQEGTESPEPKTEVKLDEHYSEIPQTTRQPMLLPTAFTLEDSNTVYGTVQDTWESNHDLGRNSPPVSEKSVPTPTSFLHISGNPEASHDSTSTGTEAIPPTGLEGATPPSPADFLPASKEHKPTEPPLPVRTESDTRPHPSPEDSSSLDYNETVSPMMVKSSGSEPLTNTTTSPRQSTTLSLREKSPTPTTHPPVLSQLPVTSSVNTSASTQVATAAYWLTSNWSAVSPH